MAAPILTDADMAKAQNNSSVLTDADMASSVTPMSSRLQSFFPPVTEGMRQSNPNLAALAQTSQDALTIPANYINQLLNNAPRGILNRLGYSFPDTTNPAAKAAANMAGIGGAVMSPINKYIGGMQGVGLIGKGLLSGLSYTPTSSSNIIDDLRQRGTQGALGSLLGVVGEMSKPVVGAATNVMQQMSNIKNPVEFAQALRGNLFANKAAAGQEFENGIVSNMAKYPDATGDLSEEFGRINSAMGDSENNPGLAAQVKGIIRKISNPEDAKFIQGLIDNPETASNLNLQQMQTVKTAINKAPAIAGKLAQGKFAIWSPAETELLDLAHNVTSTQLDAYPEFASTKGAYRDYIQNYNQVKNMFKPNVLLDKMRGGFGNEEIELAVKKALGDQNYNAITNFRNASNAVSTASDFGKEALHKALIYGPLVGAATYGVNSLINSLAGKNGVQQQIQPAE